MNKRCSGCIHIKEVIFSNAKHKWKDIFCDKGYWAGEVMIRPTECKDFRSKFDEFLDKLEENLKP